MLHLAKIHDPLENVGRDMRLPERMSVSYSTSSVKWPEDLICAFVFGGLDFLLFFREALQIRI